MIKNYFLITFRSMTKNKAFIFINVFGMGIAVACAIVGYLAYEYDASFDSKHLKGESVYRISALRSFENSTTRVGYVPLPLGEIADKTLPDVAKSTRYAHSLSNFKINSDLFPANLSYVDAEFFDIFSFDFISGNGESLKGKTNAVISETMATRLFGTPADALGKNITQVLGNELKEVKIAGVFREQPRNSSFFKRDGSAYMSHENYKDEYKNAREDDWTLESTVFLLIEDKSRLSNVRTQLQAYVVNNNKVRQDFQIREFALDPFSSMAHNDRDAEVRTWTNPAAPKSAIVGAMTMSMLILLIACFNLTNTAIAISSKRLKEIGIRKVMGSKRKQLIIQFIGETIFICFLSLLVGVALADVLIAGWNITTANNIYITPHYLDNPEFLFFLLVVLLFTGIIAGSYPAFYVTKFQPVNILKGKLKLGGTNYFTRTLLGAQFTISLITVVSAIGYFQNARYQQQYDLGFDIRGSVIAYLNDATEFNTYSHSLETDPKITAIAGARSGIFSNRSQEPVKHESREAEVDIIDVGDDYLNAMGLELLQGRDFIKDSESDQNESIIITQKMADLFGWKEPLGQQILWRDTLKLFVVGVVKDVYTQGLWREMEPMMIRYVSRDKYNQIVVSASAENLSSVNAKMKEQWSKLFPNRLYTGRMLVSDLHEVTELNKSIMYVYAFLALIAIVLSATGLFTLMSLNIIRRTKEIGVRKVLGASVLNICKIINTEFMIILSIAFALGTWISFNMTHVGMGSIWKYYQGVNVVTFATSIGLLFTISIVTIGYKVFTIATMDPVKTLRDE